MSRCNVALRSIQPRSIQPAVIQRDEHCVVCMEAPNTHRGFTQVHYHNLRPVPRRLGGIIISLFHKKQHRNLHIPTASLQFSVLPRIWQPTTSSINILHPVYVGIVLPRRTFPNHLHTGFCSLTAEIITSDQHQHNLPENNVNCLWPSGPKYGTRTG